MNRFAQGTHKQPIYTIVFAGVWETSKCTYKLADIKGHIDHYQIDYSSRRFNPRHKMSSKSAKRLQRIFSQYLHNANENCAHSPDLSPT